MAHVIYSWENEDYSHSYDSSLGLANAIKECQEIDEKANRRAIL